MAAYFCPCVITRGCRMRNYFSLQYRMINRHLTEFGIHPILGYVIGALIFAVFTTYLWYVSPYAPYMYALLGISMTTLLSETGRVNFVKQWFSKRDFQQIRALENLIVVLPFMIGLLVTTQWLFALAVVFISLLLSFGSVNSSLNIVLPTPFSRYPFEFAVGFRKNVLVFLFAVFLLVMAILYTNANLGLFIVALVLLVCLMFYMSSEPTYLVWIHHMKPMTFLWHKIKLAVLNVTILVIPFAVTFILFFPGHSFYLLIIFLLGLVYLVTALLGKYAFFPTTMNLPQGLLMAFSFLFPPMLLFLLPYFYRRCIQQLNPILA